MQNLSSFADTTVPRSTHYWGHFGELWSERAMRASRTRSKTRPNDRNNACCACYCSLACALCSTIERLRVTFMANGNREIQVDTFSNNEMSR